MDSKSADVAVKMDSTTMIEKKEIEQLKQLPETTATTTQTAVKKSTKEEKSRKKDDKSVEQVLKALNSLDTTEEKLAAMCKKYSDIVDENRKLQLTGKQTEKRLGMVQREKEQLQTEHSKAVLTRSRLESLCRELQRQNKAIKDESLLKIREEEEKRKEVSAKFQSTLNEITALMQQNNEKNSKLREDNLEMTKKFKTVCEQYELREQQVEKITKQMQLEAQLADAKLAKAKMEMAAEKEILLKEKQQLLMDLTEYQAKCQELQTTEMNLRGQISLYTDKYDEFQNALSRSNEVFGGFKGEMEKMSKKICKLEKETSSWKQRWEKSHQALLEMAADKQQRDGELALATRQLAQLQKLCRTLQAERTSLLAQLRSEGKEGDTTVKGGIPFESLQQAQDALPCPLSSAANAEPCIHETKKDSTSTQTQNENCQNAQSPITDLILNANAQQILSEPSTVNTVALEHISNVDNNKNISATLTPEQSPVKEEKGTNQDVTSGPPVISLGLTHNQELLGSPHAQILENITTPCPQNESKCAENIEIKSAPTESSSVSSPISEHISTIENKIPSPEATTIALVNGQIPIVETSEVKNKIVTTLEKKNETVEVNANHVAANGIIEQVPAKTLPAENKKGKEGAKKRKNK